MVCCKFQQYLGTSAMMLIEGSSETGLFRHLSNHVFGVRNFENTKSMRVTFLSKCLNLNSISKLLKKIDKKFFVSEIIACELLPLNCLY